MKNILKRSALLVATLLVFISLSCSSAFAASCIFGHNVVATPSVEATCTENGSYGGSYCDKCGTVIEESTIVPAKGHTQSEIPSITPATVEFDGAYVYSCVDCNMTMNSVAIPKIEQESVKLSSSNCTYNGKVRKPIVTVKDAEGKALVESQDYDVVYPDNMKMPDKYEITVSFKGNYTGEQKLSFTIAPKATTGVKVKKATASAITLEWSKTTGATGYDICKYNSSTKKYEKIDTVTANSCKVTGLKGYTTYKFKVRAYTEATDGTIIYGGYSSIISAKTTYGVTFTGSSATIYIGATKQLKVKTAPANKTLTWKSSDASIVKVSSSGKVMAVKNGTAIITAYFKVDGKTYKDTYKVTVKKPSVKLSETSVAMNEGDTLYLDVITAPTDLEVTWKSSKTYVATVSSNGLVTAKKEGTTTITASITYKGKTYKKTCKVSVKHIPTAAENITKLVDYIEKNGKTLKTGEKFIDYVEYLEGYTQTSSIIYDVKNNYLRFTWHNISTDGGVENVVIAEYDISSTYVYFATLITLFDDYGDVLCQAYTEDSIKAANYTDPSDIYEYWERNTFPSGYNETLSKLVVSSNALAMFGWDYLVQEAIGVRIYDIGFTNYR